jgi:class 3 adenylate cyclase
MPNATVKAFFSSFRAKLILSIFPVVAGVTIVALLWTEWRFSAAYQRLFEDRFEHQIETVHLARDRRADALSSVLVEMANRPEVIAAMRRRDYGNVSMRLRPTLEVLGQERLQSEFASLPRFNNRPDSKGRPQRPPPILSYIALVKPDGEILNQKFKPGPDAFSSLSAPAEPDDNQAGGLRRRPGKMSWLGNREFDQVLKEQEVAYLIVEGDERRGEQVYEVFITPFRDPTDKQFLGALMFGLPLPGAPDRILYEQSKRSESGEIMSGTFVEGKLVSSTVPADQRSAVVAAITHSINHPGAASRETILKIGGIRHRLMYRVLNPDSPFPQAAQVNFYSLAAMDQEIAGLRRSALGLGFIALLVALLLVLVISRSLSGPIRKLVLATTEIERGNFGVRVPVTKDEVGHLASAFNDMAAGLALQEKYRNILHAVADRAVAERLLEDATALSGEVREVAMLFCDIRGFTTLTENMPPQDVVELLNEHMTALTKVAYEHGGIVDKFVGDLIMVLFGAPVSNGDDSLRAVRCAQEMLKVRRQLNATSRHSLEVGIGIATGSVVAGCMGSGQRLNYTVLGHRVNLASRLCSIAQAGEIVTDDMTVRPLNGNVCAEPLDAVHLKGFSQPVECYRITAPALTA